MREGLLLLSLAFVVLLIYSNTLEGPFIFDDVRNIPNNPHLRLSTLTWEGITKAGFESPSSNRPIANISFALNYYVHQYNMAGYHWVNILIHIVTGILLYFFIKTTLAIPSLRSAYGSYGWIPFITVSIWLVNPLHTQSITYLVQRMNSMAAMFYVLSFWLYAKARLTEERNKKWALFAGCVLAGILAMGSKEIAATLPFFILLYEWYFFQDLSRAWLKRHALPFAGLLVILAIIAFIFLQTDASQKKLLLYNTKDFTLPQRVLTEFRVVIYYLSLLIFPHPSRLNLDHDFPLSHSLIDPMTTLISLGAICFLITLSVYMAKKERLLSFCILWFLGNLIIESSVIGLAIIFEHRTYLPSMLVCLMAVALAYRILRPKWLMIAAVFLVVTAQSVWTYERNRVWSDEVVFWRDCVEKSPKKAEAHNNLGDALKRKGRFDEAIKHFNEALRIKPDYTKARNNLGAALASKGDFKEASDHYSEVLRMKPDFPEAHNNQGVALASKGNFKEAINHYLEALRIKPEFPEAHNNLGNALMGSAKPEEAIDHYLKALRMRPDFPEAHNNLGDALKRKGQLKEAIKHYSEALRIKPEFPDALYNLGITLASTGNLKDAIHYYTEALRIKPDFPDAHNDLGVAWARSGNLDKAVHYFSEAVRVKPNFPEAHNNVGNALKGQGRLDKAIDHYKEALKIKSDFPEAHNGLGDALKRQGKLKEAVKHFSQALQIKPDYAKARRNLEGCLQLMEKSAGASN